MTDHAAEEADSITRQVRTKLRESDEIGPPGSPEASSRGSGATLRRRPTK